LLVAPEEIESYLAATAKAHGIDAENAAPTAGAHCMGPRMAITVESNTRAR
jgi:hypothetical protein